MISKAKLSEYRAMSALAWRLADALRENDSHEVFVMAAACHATLAMDVVPILLDEIDQLRAKRPEPVLVKMDSQSGWAR